MPTEGKSQKGRGVPGNTLAEQQEFDKEIMACGKGWRSFRRQMRLLAREGCEVYRVTLKGNWGRHGRLMVVLCAETDDGKVVSFHHADDLETMWQEMATRIEKGKLEWREDNYG